MNSLKEQELLMVENEYWVTMNNALEKLKQNKDFQTVILDGYFKDKAINGVSLLAQDAVIESGRRSAVMEDLIAISSLEDYFITIENLGTIPPEEEEEDQGEIL